VSVYFDSSHDTEDAARQIDLRWRAIRDQLATDGAAEETLAALDTAVAEGPPSRGQAGRALVAAGDTVLIDEQLPDPPPVQVVRVSPLPYLLPLIEFGYRRVPHVVVVVDRTGADLRAVDEHGVDRAQHEVQGREHPVHKAGGGGWAHWSIQHRVEEVVQRNVDEVAREASRLVDAVRARVLVLAGEVQARSALRDAIPPRARTIAVEIEAGSRAEGGDPDAFDAQVHDVVEANAEDQRRAVLERFRAERNRAGGLVAQGLSETTSALRAGAVECLLVDDAALADRMIWVGREPTEVAATEQELRASGADPTDTQRADEALPVAALATGAQIESASGEETLPDGIGALLRYPT
jgi:peptide subunit release factor 1 (eRF1)